MEKLLMSKRTFMKTIAGIGALGAAGMAVDLSPLRGTAIAREMSDGYTIVPGSAPNNCGGRCIIKAYVKNGAIKKFVTDERPDDIKGDKLQQRACVKCRSKSDLYYRQDRLIYPMKQTKERGDITGFVRISWEQAFKEIGDKLKSIVNDPKKGPESVLQLSSSADGANMGNMTISSRLLGLMGGFNIWRRPGFGYSYPGLEFASVFFFGGNHVAPPGNSRQDFVNADQIILWGFNSAETMMGTNTTYYLTMAKEKGVKIVVVDPRITRTVNALADKAIHPIPGTDAAVLLAMIHHLVKNKLDVKGGIDSKFIKKYMHGFFDDPKPAHYHDSKLGTDDLSKYIVPEGASFSAYLMGTDDTLVKKGLNKATSVYPATIGYNYSKSDPLSSKRVPMYGQVAKTPEWAEKISGVPAKDIIALAESVAAKKTIVIPRGGFQRHTEQEQAPWLLYILAAITGNFGESGRSVGFHVDQFKYPNPEIAPVKNDVVINNVNKIYDVSKLTSRTWTPTFAQNTFPVFSQADVMKNGGTGKSDWNVGQVKKMPAIKAIFYGSSNWLLSQDANTNAKASILKNKKKIELIVGLDFFLTSSMQYSDYLLPASMPFEKTQISAPWQGMHGEHIIYMNKAVEPVGEAMDDYDIWAGIARGCGIEDEFRGGKGKTKEQWLEEGFKAIKNAPITYEQWIGGMPLIATDPSKPPFIALADFRKDPVKNPLNTPSGKMEAYSQAMLDDYIARFNENTDTNGKVSLKMPLHDGSAAARYVYPVPMYIPCVNGIHADGSHPDPLKQNEKYPFQLNIFHTVYRSHSTNNNNRYLNYLYKRDAHGRPAFLRQDRIFKTVWDDNVYEPVYINPSDALELGISDGAKVMLKNDNGSVYATAMLSEQTRPGVVAMGEGSWNQLDENGVDIGGNVNSLMNFRPSRITHGCTVGSDHRVQIVKA